MNPSRDSSKAATAGNTNSLSPIKDQELRCDPSRAASAQAVGNSECEGVRISEGDLESLPKPTGSHGRKRDGEDANEHRAELPRPSPARTAVEDARNGARSGNPAAPAVLSGKSATNRHEQGRVEDGAVAIAGSTPRSTLVFDDATIQHDKKVILQDATGIIKSGRVTAIVNCCGSTRADFYLLSILAGEEEAANNTGTVMCNGTPVLAPSFRQRRALLDEDFTMFENLTVLQNLEYAAAMRVADTTALFSVSTIVSDLVLESVLTKKVKNCSAYVRRRVSLGKELLLNPVAVFFDQALQGLPTHEAQHFLGLLGRIARPLAAAPLELNPTSTCRISASRAGQIPSGQGLVAEHGSEWGSRGRQAERPRSLDGIDFHVNSGEGGSNRSTLHHGRVSSGPGEVLQREERIVVISMIQPRWALLKHVDDVILIEGSRCIFCGSLDELLAVISRHHDGTTATSRREENRGHAVAAMLAMGGVVEKSINALYRMGTDVSPTVAAAGSSVSVAGAALESGAVAERTALHAYVQANHNTARVRRRVDMFLNECAAGKHVLESKQPVPPNSLMQLLFLCKYGLLQIRGNIFVYGSLFILLVALATVLATIYSSQEGQSGMQNRIGIMFFLVSCTMLHAILAVDTRRKEYLSFQRHRAHGYHSTFVYMCYCVLSAVVIRLFFGSVFTFVVFLLANLGHEWEHYSQVMQLALIVGVLSFCSYFTVLFVVSVSRTLRLATFVLFAYYTLNLMLAGIILNINTLPAPIRALSLGSVVRLAYESAILTQFIGKDFGCVAAHSIRAPNDSLPPEAAHSMAERRRLLSIRVDAFPLLSDHATCYTGKEYAQFLGFSPSREWTNLGWLAGISALFVVHSFIALLVYRPPRKLVH